MGKVTYPWPMKKLTILLISAAICSLHTDPVSADSFRVQAGILAGYNDQELEDRLYLDDLIEGTGLGRFNSSWEGHSDLMIRPLGAEYEMTLRTDKDSLLIGGNFFSSGGEIRYTSFGFLPSVSFTSHRDFFMSESDGYFGYKVRIPDTAVRLTPLAGVRFFTESFIYNSVTFGPGSIVVTPEDRKWKSRGAAFYGGLRGNYQIDSMFDVYGEFLISAPSGGLADGNTENQRLSAGFTNSQAVYVYEKASAAYRTDFYSVQAGVRFWITKNLNVFAGLRHEKYSVSYPGYYNVPVAFAANGNTVYGGFDLTEYITDYIFYTRTQETRRGLLQVGTSLDFDF